jgi:hypothetical protein
VSALLIQDFNPGSSATTVGIAAFLAMRLFFAHGTIFQMWGCFLGSK